MVFKSLLENDLSEINDSFGRPPWIFNSDEMLKKSALSLARLHARVRKITRIADCG